MVRKQEKMQGRKLTKLRGEEGIETLLGWFKKGKSELTARAQVFLGRTPILLIISISYTTQKPNTDFPQSRKCFGAIF